MIHKVVKSIEQFGLPTLVLIDEKGNVLAGHGCLLAARRLGITKIPVVLASISTRENLVTQVGELEAEATQAN